MIKWSEFLKVYSLYKIFLVMQFSVLEWLGHYNPFAIHWYLSLHQNYIQFMANYPLLRIRTLIPMKHRLYFLRNLYGSSLGQTTSTFKFSLVMQLGWRNRFLLKCQFEPLTQCPVPAHYPASAVAHAADQLRQAEPAGVATLNFRIALLLLF